MKLPFALFLFFGMFFSALAQKSTRTSVLFKPRNFGRYPIADYYAPIPKMRVGVGVNQKEYNLSPTRTNKAVVYNETNLGTELPIYFRERSFDSVNTKFAISIPISMNVWFDFTEQITAPILNTDYRFALMEFTYLRTTNKSNIKNFGLKFIPFFHESTHIGDELTIYRVNDSLPITRVNVSYETFELAFFLNDENGSYEKNTHYRIGMRGLWNKHKGWYSIRSEEGDISKVVSSKKWLEFYAQLQLVRSSGWIADKKRIFVTSAEVRYRVRFGYPFEHITEENETKEFSLRERYVPSLNLLAGWKFRSNVKEKANLGLYARVYLGINPHGQFRNIPLYPFGGIALIYEP